MYSLLKSVIYYISPLILHVRVIFTDKCPCFVRQADWFWVLVFNIKYTYENLFLVQ